MYEISNLYLAETKAQKIQHIRGRITLLSGDIIELDDNTLLERPSYEKQCVEDPEKFMFGQLYTGTAEIPVRLSDIDRLSLKNSKVFLEYSIGSSEWIPVGTWTVSDPERDSSEKVILHCIDSVGLLDVPVNITAPGVVWVETAMSMVTDLTGVEFAQTPEELDELASQNISGRFAPVWCSTCREEVAAIAQLIGGFACADRYGRIVFRRFGSTPVRYITADERMRADLKEYSMAVRGVGYLDKYGCTYAQNWQGSAVNTESTLIFTDCKYVWDTADHQDRQYEPTVTQIASALKKIPVWTPGSIEYFGDPALDIGDVIELEDGIGKNVKFIITSDCWQFRAPQTLISAGVGNDTVGSSSAVSSAAYSQTTYNVGKNLECLEIECFPGELEASLSVIGGSYIMCRSRTFAAVSVTAVLSAENAGNAEIHVLLDGVMQDCFSSDTLTAGERRTVSFTVFFSAEQGRHIITIEVKGTCNAERISAHIFGQDIAADTGTDSPSSYFTWHSSEEGIIIAKYTGTLTDPAVPSALGGGEVRTIGSGSFSGSEVEYVHLPEGVTEIE